MDARPHDVRRRQKKTRRIAASPDAANAHRAGQKNPLVATMPPADAV
jgi:hypothetical protein